MQIEKIFFIVYILFYNYYYYLIIIIYLFIIGAYLLLHINNLDIIILIIYKLNNFCTDNIYKI